MGIGANNSAKFFLGATTPQGFASCYHQSYNIDDYEYIGIVKGGPNKHDFIKQVADRLSPCDNQAEFIYSSQNPSRYDGIIFPTLRACIIDGSTPHPLEPRYYDAFETILSLGDYCSKEYIKNHKDEILQLTDSGSRLYERCVRFICAAGSLLDDSYILALTCTNEDKISSFCERTLAREIKQNLPSSGKEHSRFLSAVTANGIILFEDTIRHYCTNLYVIEDEFGAAANLILQKIRSGATERGYDIILCWCPFAPFKKLEHIFIPALQLGFVTSNRWHTLKFDDARMIHSRRFTSLESLSVRKQRLSFNKRAASELIDAAQTIMQQSQDINQRLEDIYMKAVDGEKFSMMVNKVVQGLLAASGK